jgi:AmmeMemoRadiSam system protein A
VNTQVDDYTAEERTTLLAVARRTLEAATSGDTSPELEYQSLPPRLLEMRACFVTLYIDTELRGCTGTLAARRPLAEEVAYTTVQTAFNDPRFPPVSAAEVPLIRIEISVLTPSRSLKFESPEQIPQLIRPHIDGVTLKFGMNRSTFLPQVWEKISDPVQFLGMLSRKMGLPEEAWRYPGIEVETYQSISIEEPQHLQAAS